MSHPLSSTSSVSVRNILTLGKRQPYAIAVRALTVRQFALLDLMGAADAAIPPIAGRSPSYMVRQMWDVQQGTRNSEPPNLMKLIVANLTREDMVAIAAYVASRTPREVASR